MENEKLVKILQFQKNEITEYHVYRTLSHLAKDSQNKNILSKIAQDELRHYRFWKDYSEQDVLQDGFKVTLYITIARLLGLSFAVKLMELGEEDAQKAYGQFAGVIPKVRQLITDEDRHEMETLRLIHDQYLKFAGSIVLGLNDALVELTGALAGLTFALQNSRLVAISGLVTGIAAAFSMATSEYMSTKAEEKGKKRAFQASIYTGIVYLAVVILLVAPFLLFNRVYISLIITLITAIFIIIIFSFYVSVAQQVSFKKHFLEMSILSLGVATISFILGLILRNTLGIEI